MADDGDMQEHLYKVLVVGDIGAGKTSIIKRYVHQLFSMHYKATIGVDFALKMVTWDANTIVRLQLWDIAGQERFGNMTRVYYKEAVGAIVVFDITRLSTFDAVLKWKHDIDSKVTLPGTDKPIPVLLLANKCDLKNESNARTDAELDKFVAQHGFCGWFECSAKENTNVDRSMNFLVTKIMESDVKRGPADPNLVRPDAPKDGESSGKNCNC